MTIALSLDNLVVGKVWKNVRYGTTRRDMSGVSLAPYDQFNLGLHCGDNAEHAQANREQLCRLLPSRPIWLNQVHGTAVLDADLPFDYPATADAAMTTQVGTVLAIMTADCLPVVIADTQGHVIGAAHAGWRGLQAGVLEQLAQAMRAKYPSSEWQAWIGPAISQAVFEVGQEVYDAFVSTEPVYHAFFKPHTPGKYWADLPAIAEHKLRQQGIQYVEQSGECTYLQSDKYFSYRRENPTGRIVTLVWKTA